MYKEYLELLENEKKLKEQLKVLETQKKEAANKIIAEFEKTNTQSAFNEETKHNFTLQKRTTKKVKLSALKELDEKIFYQFQRFSESEFKKSKDPVVKAFIKNNEAEVFEFETKITGLKVEQVEASEVESIDL